MSVTRWIFQQENRGGGIQELAFRTVQGYVQCWPRMCSGRSGGARLPPWPKHRPKWCKVAGQLPEPMAPVVAARIQKYIPVTDLIKERFLSQAVPHSPRAAAAGDAGALS